MSPGPPAYERGVKWIYVKVAMNLLIHCKRNETKTSVQCMGSRGSGGKAAGT
jgi:hypothetical protein